MDYLTEGLADADDLVSAYTGIPKSDLPPSVQGFENETEPIHSEAISIKDDSRKRVTTGNRRLIKDEYITSSSPGNLSSPSVHSTQSEARTYSARTKSGDVICRYNCKDSSHWEAPGSLDLECKIDKSPFGREVLDANTKYMFQRTREMSMIVDELVSRAGDEIIKYFALEPQNLAESSTDECAYVGRIRGDGKLTPGSVFFEGTIEYSNGHIVSLDLSRLEEYFIFPGQVLGVLGENSLGRCVTATRLFAPHPNEFKHNIADISNDMRLLASPLKVLIAAGPFTTGDSLGYEPFDDLLKVIKESPPNLCILIGPFLDSSHPLIDSDSLVINNSFEGIFQSRMNDLFKAIEGLKTKVVVVPNFKDAHHQPVFPTPPFNIGEENHKKWDKSITVVSDPAEFSFNGIVFGVTSVDILRHLGQNELAFSTVASERMGRIARHLLSQRSYYPLYPPDESIPLDVEHWTKYAQMSSTPHVLILPSDLRFFIKDVDGTVVVNPERLTKGNSGGTYARLVLELKSDDLVDNLPIADYVMGEIVKI